uniref:PH domain-containing protein n=1 Tax=Cellulomonas endophytica TaxID=2494735 RepID=UPI001010A6C3
APDAGTPGAEGPGAAAAAPGGRPRAGSAGGPAFETAPERVVYEVPAGRVVGSVLRSGTALWLLVGAVAVVVAGVVLESFGTFVFLLAPALGAVGWVAGRLNHGIGFRAATSPDGIRLRHGLTEARRQTVPPGRVQAVRLTQPLLWRGPDWWRVDMNVAGYGGAADSAQNQTVLLPVGTRDEAVTAVWLVLPDLGVEDPRALLDTLLSADPAARAGALTSPRGARWVDPVAWRRRAAVVTPRALLSRTGRLERVVEVVPHERTQSLGTTQGPLQRRLGLASVRLHSTPGPVSPSVDHLGAATAAALLDELADRARAARAGAGPEQWMRTADAGSVADPVAGPVADPVADLVPAPVPAPVDAPVPSAATPGQPGGTGGAAPTGVPSPGPAASPDGGRAALDEGAR